MDEIRLPKEPTERRAREPADETAAKASDLAQHALRSHPRRPFPLGVAVL
jgi:hypothetical protein